MYINYFIECMQAHNTENQFELRLSKIWSVYKKENIN